MFFASIAWLITLAGLAALWMTLTAHAVERLRNCRTGALAAIGTSIGLLAVTELTSVAPVEMLATSVSWTVVIGLVTLVVAGVKESRLQRYLAGSNDATARFWDQLAHALVDGESLDKMLLSSAAAVRSATGADCAVVYKLADEGRDTVYVGATCDHHRHHGSEPDDQNLALLARRGVADSRVAEYTQSGQPGQNASVTTWGMVPIRNDSTAYGAILLRRPVRRMDDPNVAPVLQMAGRMIARVVEDWLNVTTGATAQNLVDRIPLLIHDLHDEDSFERGLPRIAKAFDGLVDADYIALTWLDRSRFHEDRACMVIGEQRILDSRRRWPIWESTTRRLLTSERPLITPDLSLLPEEEDSKGRPLEFRLGYRSRIVVPIRVRNRLIGTLTLAHSEAVKFGEDESRLVSQFMPAITEWLKKLGAERRIQTLEASTMLAIRLETEWSAWATDSDLLKAALPGIESTGLRLYRLTEDRQALDLVASAGRTSQAGIRMERPSEPVPLADTPWHRWVMKDGASRYVDQSDPESLMSDTEARVAMLPDMKTGWIVPVRHNNKTLGFLDAVEVRDPDRRTLGEPERLMLSAIARAVTHRWQAAAEPIAAVPGSDANVRHQLTELNGRVVNSITGIIGSVELIRHKQENITPETMKYLRLIETSATKIHESLMCTMNQMPRGQADLASQRSETVARRLFGALAMPGGRITEKPASERMREAVSRAGAEPALLSE